MIAFPIQIQVTQYFHKRHSVNSRWTMKELLQNREHDKWLGSLSSTNDLFSKAFTILPCAGSRKYVLVIGLLLRSIHGKRKMTMGNPFPVTYLF